MNGLTRVSPSRSFWEERLTIALAQRPAERSKARLPDWAVGYLFVLPACIGFVLFYLVPTLRALQISLTDWNLLRAPKFIALANYQKLFVDPKFWDSMWLSL